MRPLMNTKEAAKVLGIKEGVLDKARREGLVSYIQFSKNGNVYYTAEALREFMERSTHKMMPGDVSVTYRKRRDRER